MPIILARVLRQSTDLPRDFNRRAIDSISQQNRAALSFEARFETLFSGGIVIFPLENFYVFHVEYCI